MPTKLNSEFNYRYQIEGNTPWEKIKHLRGFYEGRVRAAQLEPVAELRRRALEKEIEHLKETGAEEHVILRATADLFEAKTMWETEKEAFELCRQEIKIIEKLLAEYQAIAEPTRVPGYTDEQMFELNAANEFTAMIGREIYAEVMANGRASPAKLRNAMSNPHTMRALKDAGILPPEMQYIEGGNDPLNIGLKCTVISNSQLGYSSTEILNPPIMEPLKLNLPTVEQFSDIDDGIIKLFSVPVYISKYAGDMSGILEHVENLDYSEKQTHMTCQSNNNFLLDSPEFTELKKFIDQQLHHYCVNILQVHEKVRVTQSWVNKSGKGRAHHYHTHPNSLISGVFYLKFNKNNPPITFHNTRYQDTTFSQIMPNEFNTEAFMPYLQAGDLIIFPSNLGHSVTANQDEEVRISLSFNTFAVGSLGRKDFLTYVDLPE
jgi:uncharacterized protein (TIGR02466 family)